ncbi:MBL fold metallo-hydrolase [Aciditerrimonas ferrireducens]|uniref:MBL fold metallo-hydrolase n=1 Tax=Aciditerrimonas ferrireducens TaxID=667306 RepID=A0ABV6C2B3_9ACTN
MAGVADTPQDRLYFRQLLAGRDLAVGDPLATQMVNFVYLIGDRASGEALAVDPAYDPEGLLAVLAADGMRLVGVLATHYHPDHVGGDLMGHHVAGVAELLGLVDVPVHLQAEEVPWVQRVTGLGASELVGHRSGDRVRVGDVEVELVHTPGHTPGSQCFAVADRLVAGDTLFLDGCGRTDLPGGDPEALYESLTTRLARFDDGTVLYPGHRYSPASAATLGSVREHNVVFRVKDPAQWLAMFGGR